MLDYNNQQDWPNGFGGQQSPIEIHTNKLEIVHQPLPFVPKSKYTLHQEINDQTTIRLTGSGQAEIFGRDFSFQQVHFHSQSEHVIDGKHYPLEVHLVHQNEIGQLVVVALMVQEGAPSKNFQQIIDHFDAAETHPVDLDITDWLNFSRKGFHYLGSLTTPPLQEGVEWIVITDTMLTVDDDQINWFRSKFSKDYRNIQPMNDRSVQWYD